MPRPGCVLTEPGRDRIGDPAGDVPVERCVAADGVTDAGEAAVGETLGSALLHGDRSGGEQLCYELSAGSERLSERAGGVHLPAGRLARGS
jgi:hypothetical protein